MSTQSRLDAYYAAEARILERGQAVRLSERQQQLAELAEIRKAITALEAKLVLEQNRAAQHGTLVSTRVHFDGCDQ